MVAKLTRADLQRLRLRAQKLARPAAGDVAGLVGAMGALQAQEKPAALLALRPRLQDVTAAGATAALEDSRRIVRTWCLRGTLHLLASEDVRWLLRLVAPRMLKNSGRRYRELGLDEQTLVRATRLIAEALAAEGALTRAELGAYLERRQIDVQGQRLPHLLRRAALLGLICLGPDRDGAETYVLLDEWLGAESAPPDLGWEELAGRYLEAYGPVGVDDFATWSGAYQGEARHAFTALRDEVVEVEVDGERYVCPAAQLAIWEQAPAAEPAVHLLPAYDPFLLGYRSRQWLVAPAFASEIHPGGGFLRPALVVNGEAAGTWRIKRGTAPLQVEVSPFEPLGVESEGLVGAEVAELGRFWGVETALSISAR